jgi:hypothetical protein
MDKIANDKFFNKLLFALEIAIIGAIVLYGISIRFQHFTLLSRIIFNEYFNSS